MKPGKSSVRARLNRHEKVPTRESHDRLLALLDILPDILFVLDREGRILDYHAPRLDMLHLSPDQFIGKTMSEFVPAPTAKIVYAALEKALEHGSQRGVIYSLPYPDGEHWFEASLAAQGNPQAPDARVVAIVRDITARKRVEDELRESETRTRAIHDNLPGGLVYQVDTGKDGQQRRVTLMSKGVAQLHGVSADEIMRDSGIFYSQILEEDRAMAAKLEARAIATMTPFQAEVRIRLPSGKIRWRLFASAPRRLPNGHLIWDGIELDVTERKQTEAALQQAHGELEEKVKERTAELLASQQALAQSEEQFRQMAESIQEVFWLVDVRSKDLLFVSPAYDRIWGRSRTAPPPGISSWLASVHPADRKWVEESFVRWMEKGEFKLMENRILRPDGSIRWISNRGWAIRDARGKIIRIAGVARDITDRRQLEADILNASEVERQRIGRDLHDSLGQSLTGIGYLAEAVREELARKAMPEAAEMRKLVRLIGKTSDQAHAMARGLLPVDLKQRGIVAALQELAVSFQELFGISCRYAGLEDVRLDDLNVARQLYRIAQEAATNAAKHAKAKRIEIRLAKNRKGLLLTVRDTGKGIPAKPRKGAGMGLEIMTYRAGMIGAMFWIDSVRNQGTTVSCLLPRTAPKRR